MIDLKNFSAITKIPSDKAGVPAVVANDAQLTNILNTVYAVAGIIGVIVIIIAGFLYVTSSGDAANVKRAKNAILYTAVGLVVIMLAFVITNYVIGRF